MSTKSKSWLSAALGLFLVLGVLVGIKVTQIGAMVRAGKAATVPPEAVTTVPVQAVDWEMSTGAVGTLVAVHGTTLGAELPGLVRAIGFDSGTFVKRGTVLVKLDTSSEEAQLAGARADAELAAAELQRARTLRESRTTSQSDLDVSQARARQTSAAVANLEALIAKKTIRAPFDGRIAIRQVELGQVLSPGTTITSLQSVSPIHADFWLPQQALAEISVGESTRLRVDVAKDRHWQGQITTINPEVDPATRNVRVRATFANEDGFLRPGMFVNVKVVSPKKQAVVIIPSTAVLFAPYGDTVYVVNKAADDSTMAVPRFVRLGERRGDFVAIESGLRAGDIVVSTGAFKLRGTTRVVANNALAPDASVTPTPMDD